MSCECDFCEYHLKMRQIKRGEGLIVTEYMDPKNPSEKAYYDVGGGGGGDASTPSQGSRCPSALIIRPMVVKHMKNVMIDLETLGNGKNACVVQIGACYFDPSTGEIGETFAINIDAKSAMDSGAEMDASTVYWWLSQSREAINSILEEPREDTTIAFQKFNDFLSKAQQIWSHATFDFVIVTETLKRLNIKPTFSFRAARDIRTLVQLAGSITVDSEERVGVHHNGLSDALHQVKYTVKALNKIKKKIG